MVKLKRIWKQAFDKINEIMDSSYVTGFRIIIVPPKIRTSECQTKLLLSLQLAVSLEIVLSTNVILGVNGQINETTPYLLQAR